jgi:hypothetical protein
MNLRKALTGIVICTAFIGLNKAAHADTVLKLSLGEVSPDLVFDGLTLHTVNDGNAGTTGDQNTAVDFTGFLNGIPDITTNIASFSLAGLAPQGAATVVGTVFIQNFAGGQFSLFDPSNVLLLSGTLNASSLTGSFAPSSTGSLFTTMNGNFTGGTLLPMLQRPSFSLSLTMTNVNGGSGFVLSGAVQPFTADSTVEIGATQQVPEPGTWSLLVFGALTAATLRRRLR